MIDWIVKFYVAHTVSLLLYAYLIPLLVLAFIYGKRTVTEYRTDLANRAKAIEDKPRYEAEWAANQAKPYTQQQHVNGQIIYRPTLKLGHIIWRLVGIVTPSINVILLVGNLDILLEAIGRIGDWIWKFFDIPLVPKR